MQLKGLMRCAMLLATLVLFAGPAASSTLSLKEIREEGVIRQQWDTSCGAAALATVFTYTFNDPVTEREVASGLLRQTEPMKVRHRGGFSMLDMKRYAVERGYRGIGFRDMEFEDIRYLDAPIVPVSFYGYNHYVVYKGLTPAGDVQLGDPAFGNRTLSREQFEDAWVDGITFVMLRGTE